MKFHKELFQIRRLCLSTRESFEISLCQFFIPVSGRPNYVQPRALCSNNNILLEKINKCHFFFLYGLTPALRLDKLRCFTSLGPSTKVLGTNS